MLGSLFSNPLEGLAWILAFVAALTFHEFCHGLAAKLQGDDTAERAGRLTLNPLAHIDPLGFLLVLVAGFGWAKPVPYNPYNLRNQKWGPVLVAAAGPLANLALFIVAGLTYRLLMFAGVPVEGSTVGIFIGALMQVNVVLFAFNLIPLPPLDGSKFLLLALQGPQYARTRFWIETRGPMTLLLLVAADALLLNGLIFGTIIDFMSNLAFKLIGL
jgi:Zn-dependent protease